MGGGGGYPPWLNSGHTDTPVKLGLITSPCVIFTFAEITFYLNRIIFCCEIIFVLIMSSVLAWGSMILGAENPKISTYSLLKGHTNKGPLETLKF